MSLTCIQCRGRWGKLVKVERIRLRVKVAGERSVKNNNNEVSNDDKANCKKYTLTLTLQWALTSAGGLYGA